MIPLLAYHAATLPVCSSAVLETEVDRPALFSSGGADGVQAEIRLGNQARFAEFNAPFAAT